MTHAVTFRAPAAPEAEPEVRPPLWLLDVDGVLNAVARHPDPNVWPEWRHGRATGDGVEWPIVWSPEVVATVRRLHEAGLAEVRWLTTWRHEANGALRALLGLPAFAVVGGDREPEPSPAAGGAVEAEEVTSHGALRAAPRAGEWWKLTAARALLEREPRPLVWTDDDLRHEHDAVAWANTAVPSRLLVAPRTETGLTPAQLRDIEEFCALHAAR